MDKNFIVNVLNDRCRSGDAYIQTDRLFWFCRNSIKNLTYEKYTAEIIIESNAKLIYVEGNRVYSYVSWRYECRAAANLQKYLLNNTLIANRKNCDLSYLSSDQKEALDMALSHRLSLILGGAGSGKTTLISAIVKASGAGKDSLLISPTGKAARNLTDKTGLSAKTIHSALGKAPNTDFLDADKWHNTRLVIIDEASMLTLEMFSGILNSILPCCRLVLIGDPNQLASVGIGNVVNDLIELGFPCYTLTLNHRLTSKSNALANNVVRFPALTDISDLCEDESFIIRDTESLTRFAEEAAEKYLSEVSFQVISPSNKTVHELNALIQEWLNPNRDCVSCCNNGNEALFDCDRVMITENRPEIGVVNGDVGYLRIISGKYDPLEFSIVLPDGRRVCWSYPESYDAIKKITLAYAITVHRSQGSEYDTVMIPLLSESKSMLNRNLFYTAISRARSNLIIYGTRDTVQLCITRSQKKRISSLPERVKALMKATA